MLLACMIHLLLTGCASGAAVGAAVGAVDVVAGPEKGQER
jgi:hypothetical protein